MFFFKQCSYVQVPAGCLSLLVEMDRFSGDPVLFLKAFLDGSKPTAIPTVMDFAEFSDEHSFRSRLNHHFRLTTNVPEAGQRYYVAVYNNDAYVQQRARYELRASWVTARAGGPAVLCPKDCWSRGKCRAGGGAGQFRCYCNQGRLRVLFSTRGEARYMETGLCRHLLGITDPQ